jgi:hypothetical protein|tara:strand:+ start:1463 stop:1612 length:150 start_codon:yes stop_codon:yes gene_type:complete
MYWIQVTKSDKDEKYRYEFMTAEQLLFLRNHYINSGFKVETGKKDANKG